MKVLFIVSAYPREPGDVITPWLVVLIRRLAAAGVQVDVLAPAYRGLRSQTLDGVRVHRFRYAPARWEDLTHDQTAPDRIRERPAYLGLVPTYVAAGAFAAARLARRHRYDVIHAFWPLPHALLGLAAHHAARTPLVLTFFGVELRWLRADFPALAPLFRRMIAGAQAVTAISAATAAEVARLVPGAEPVLIPFGAAVEPRSAGAEGGGLEGWGAGAARDEAGAADAFRVLFVGRLVERKGVPVLLRALTRLRGGRPATLAVVGEGPSRAGWEAEARALGLGSAVRFLGWVEEAELMALLSAADVLVLPAVEDAKGDTEGLGVVLIEALSAGTPVIASRSGGIVDIVRHEETGLLVEPGDPAALAAALERYRDEPALGRRHAAAGGEWVRRQFSWDAIVERLIEVYRRVARGEGGVAAAGAER